MYNDDDVVVFFPAEEAGVESSNISSPTPLFFLVVRRAKRRA